MSFLNFLIPRVLYSGQVILYHKNNLVHTGFFLQFLIFKQNNSAQPSVLIFFMSRHYHFFEKLKIMEKNLHKLNCSYAQVSHTFNRSHSVSQEVVSKFFVGGWHPINFQVNYSKLPFEFHVEFPVIEWIHDDFYVKFHMDIFTWEISNIDKIVETCLKACKILTTFKLQGLQIWFLIFISFSVLQILKGYAIKNHVLLFLIQDFKSF